MKRLRLDKADVLELINAYRASAAEHGAATEAGDYRKANRHHDAIASIYRELRARGETSRFALLPLLDDIDPHVRTWAAAHALDFAPERGEPVLRRLARIPGVVGLNAEMTLQEWSKGSLAFP
jgi:hypothetical protein